MGVDMREEASVEVDPRTTDVQEETLSCEILAVGPQYREVDYRFLAALLRKTPFLKRTPL